VCVDRFSGTVHLYPAGPPRAHTSTM
jgi:hypothetical protein